MGRAHRDLGARGGFMASSFGLILVVPDPSWPWLEQAGMALAWGSPRVPAGLGSDCGSLPLSSSLFQPLKTWQRTPALPSEAWQLKPGTSSGQQNSLKSPGCRGCEIGCARHGGHGLGCRALAGCVVRDLQRADLRGSVCWVHLRQWDFLQDCSFPLYVWL